MATDPSALESDALAQAEEREALCAIYGDESVRWDPSLRVLTLAIGGDGDDEEGDDAASLLELELRVLLPEDYPSRSPPVVEVVVVGKDDDDSEPLPPAAAELAKEVDDACQQQQQGANDAADGPVPFWSPGEVALFPLAERAREVRRAWLERQRQEARRRRQRQQEEEEEEERRRLAAAAAAATKDTDDDAALARKRTPPSEDGCDPAHVDRMAQLIVSGGPVVERKSTFQAHVAAVESVADVKAVVAALLRVPKIRNCTHNIMAYRIRRESGGSSTTATTWLADCDDDGEDAAGGRLLQLLHSSGCEGVVVVVSRWFGGVLLGPSRFALINNTARALLVREGYISNAGGGGGKKGGGGNK
jgi:hypothetical protein